MEFPNENSIAEWLAAEGTIALALHHDKIPIGLELEISSLFEEQLIDVKRLFNGRTHHFTEPAYITYSTAGIPVLEIAKELNSLQEPRKLVFPVDGCLWFVDGKPLRQFSEDSDPLEWLRAGKYPKEMAAMCLARGLIDEDQARTILLLP